MSQTNKLTALGDEMAGVWPYFVLVMFRCEQVGMMRFKLLRQAKEAAQLYAEGTGRVCQVFGKNNKMVYDTRQYEQFVVSEERR